MEQFEIVLKVPKGKHYELSEIQNGEQILRLISDSPKTLQKDVACSQIEEPFFTKITAEDREKVKKWVVKQKGKTSREKVFLKKVAEMIDEISADYWIANLEPSVENGKIYYAENHDVGERPIVFRHYLPLLLCGQISKQYCLNLEYIAD